MEQQNVQETEKKYADAVEQVSIHWSQDPDCCADSNVAQNSIRVFTQDGGGGPYIVIQTERWALSDDDESIDKFCKRLKAVLKLHENPRKALR